MAKLYGKFNIGLSSSLDDSHLYTLRRAKRCVKKVFLKNTIKYCQKTMIEDVLG